MNTFDFFRFFGNNHDSNSAPKKRAKKQQGRICRFEELEGREMLSATPWTLVDDVFAPYDEMSGGHTPPGEFQSFTLEAGGRMPAALVQNALAPLGAATELPPANGARTELSSAEIAYLQEKYADIDLAANWNKFGNITVLDASGLSASAFQNHINTAAANNGLLVVRTDLQNKITLTGTALSINSGNVSIVSLGAEKLTISANENKDLHSGVLNIVGNATVGLAGLTITKGNYDNPYLGGGGGIYNYGGILTITCSTISGNTASNSGGGIQNVDGTVTITDSIISGNFANSGGGICNYDGILMITGSIISGNTASGSGGGIDNYGGVIYYGGGILTVTNSIISGNIASRDGGGVSSNGAGGGTLKVMNSTISENTAAHNGGGIHNYTDTVTITSSTISDNTTSNSGGGIYHYLGTTILNNTIVAKNSANIGIDIYRDWGTITGNNNLIGSGEGQSSLVNGVNGNIVGTATRPIDPLFDNDCSLHDCCYCLLPNSPAINKGRNDLAVDAKGNPLQYDLAGNPRIVHGTVDIGAYEYQGVLLTHPQSATYTQGETATALFVMASGNGELTYQWYKDGVIITDETSATYTPSTATVGSAEYHCVVTNTLNGSSEMATSNIATITITAAPPVADTPVISVHPQLASYTQEQTATPLSVTANGNGTLSYQWYKSGDSTVLSTSREYTPSTASVGSVEYYCVVTNTLNGASKTVTSTTATITVTALIEQPDVPGISVHPQSASYTQGQTATALSVTASGNGTLSYAWYQSESGIVLATSQTYIPSTNTVGKMSYCCVVTNTLNGTSEVAVSDNAVIVVTESMPVKPPGTGAKPVKVSGIKKANVSLSTATISWKANAKNTFYEVVCTSHPEVAVIGSVEMVNGKPTVTITGLQPKTSYKFKIISYNGDTPAKTAAKVTVKTKTYAAPKVTKKTVTSDSVTLTWKNSPFVETDRYEIRDAVSGTVLATVPATGITGKVSWPFEDLTPKTAYKYKIVAVSDLLDDIESKVAKVSVKTKK